MNFQKLREGLSIIFSKEIEMYPIIKDWLESRERDPCHQISINSYTFDTGQRFRADLIGVYLRDGNHRFVGVEAKLDAPFSLKPLGQAQAMQTFCHEVYLAIPHDVFSGLDDRKKETLQSLLSNQKMGLLLVRIEVPKVQEKVIAYPIPFRLDLYKEAVKVFSYVSEEEGDEILSQFRSIVGHRFGGWWAFFVNEGYATLFHTDFSSEDEKKIIDENFGKIVFEDDRIVLSTDLSVSKFITEVFDENNEDVSDIIKRHLKRLSDDELKFTYLDNPWFIVESSRIDLSFFNDIHTIYNLATMLASQDVCFISINLIIERPVLINVRDESQMKKVIRNLADAYSWLHDLALDLGKQVLDSPAGI